MATTLNPSQTCAGVNIDDIWSWDAWRCKWRTALPNAVIYPSADIATPPYVTKAPPSATQAPYNVSQQDINNTIAQVWTDWKTGAIGANTDWAEHQPDWLTLGLLGVGLFVAVKVVSK